MSDETEKPGWETGDLEAPFPWFGGKRRAAPIVWEKFGNVSTYIEPFFGSGAVLLCRPVGHYDETTARWGNLEIVNDKDGFIANFWRAVQQYPHDVADAADHPVNENDLHARHYAIIQRSDEIRRALESDDRVDLLKPRLEADPEFCDPEVAGWWVWGLCAWIGSGWCSGEGPWVVRDGMLVKGSDDGEPGVNRTMPSVGIWGLRGVHRKMPIVNGTAGVHRKIPMVGHTSRGIHRKLPMISPGHTQQGVHRSPPLIHHGQGVHGKDSDLHAWFANLSFRLRHVRVCSGDWTRVLSRAVTRQGAGGTIGVFLDPPYSMDDRVALYNQESACVAAKVREWAVENGNVKGLRIALCGYEGHYEMPPDWTCHAWKSIGGYGAHRKLKDADDKANTNTSRERVWFSPECSTTGTLGLLG